MQPKGWKGPSGPSRPPGPNRNPVSRTGHQTLLIPHETLFTTSILAQNTNIQPKGWKGPSGPSGPPGPNPNPCDKYRDMGFTESKIKEMTLDPKYTMLDAFNGKRFNFGRSITRAKDGFVKKFLESCNDEPEGEKKDYDVGATTIQCCDLLQGECKL